MSRFNLFDGVEITLQTSGVYKFVNTMVAAGPTVLNTLGADPSSSTLQPMTDGTFTTSGDGLVELGAGPISADIQAGDFMTLEFIRSSKV
jgi:hypothetical protein